MASAALAETPRGTAGKNLRIVPSPVQPDPARLPRGQVVELPVSVGRGTSFVLEACRAAQAEDPATWCAFVDPEGTLYAPGVLQAGVDLSRLLVVRPLAEALERTLIRLAEARVFAVLGVDLVSQKTPLSHKLVRRLAQAVEGTGAVVLLVTDALGEARAPHWPADVVDAPAPRRPACGSQESALRGVESTGASLVQSHNVRKACFKAEPGGQLCLFREAG